MFLASFVSLKTTYSMFTDPIRNLGEGNVVVVVVVPTIFLASFVYFKTTYFMFTEPIRKGEVAAIWVPMVRGQFKRNTELKLWDSDGGDIGFNGR
ncbi:hypothetical protein CYMTET_51357 [Cymbomonas tetramitiformis]|uniref:Uncharacterized protein n=1 Tax=Cymbomonas tetramitiformis TaxID=36881 RepID=A0AAE0BN70_9CHLO|nr:hypothetical protein CYMTET_51357 [Cymbomonas tetramitiformis]